MLTWTLERFSYDRSRKDTKVAWPENVWLGVSLENQDYTWRIKHLQKSPAYIRFISIEPLLNPVSLDESLLDGIQWVIVGGESGPRARPMEPEWVYKIQKECKKYRVPFFFKQWGTFDASGKRVGKKAAGRVLDGKTWDEVPLSLSQ
jgi:protein gp37